MKGFVYLASPYSHPDPQVRYDRYVWACRAAAHLMRQGHVVFSPIAHSHPIEMHSPDLHGFDFWIAQDLPILDHADRLVVLTIEGWDCSKGVATEIDFAINTSSRLTTWTLRMLHLTPEMLVLSYALLRETTPFKSWKLPHPDTIAFAVSRTVDACGHFGVTDKGVNCIWISGAAVSRLDTLVRIMAHEMIHLKQFISKETTKGHHNARFRQRAAVVCRAHGFDPKLFV